MSIEIIPTGAALDAEIRGVDPSTMKLSSLSSAPRRHLLSRSRGYENLTDTTLIASPGWTKGSREAGGIDNVLLAIGSNMDEGHYAAFILDLDGNNIEAVYRESKTAPRREAEPVGVRTQEAQRGPRVGVLIGFPENDRLTQAMLTALTRALGGVPRNSAAAR